MYKFIKKNITSATAPTFCHAAVDEAAAVAGGERLLSSHSDFRRIGSL